MISALPAILADHYHGWLSLVAAVAIFGLTFVIERLAVLVPTFASATAANRQAAAEKMERPTYAANQGMNRKWGLFFYLVIFAAILPFTLTLAPQSPLRIARDVVVILMFYDFFYYLVHRFLFHDSGYFRGPLMWVHGVHHRQHNPCRQDSSFIHPLEVALGLGLYVGSLLALSFVFGNFHVVTVVITWIAFSQINLHNHDLWSEDRFPYRYLSTMSKMHHHHHAKFTGGNFATISLLYDWLFGTLDYGQGYASMPKAAGGAKSPAAKSGVSGPAA